MSRARFIFLFLFFPLLVLRLALVDADAQKSVWNAQADLAPRFNALLDDFNCGYAVNNWRYNTYTGGLGGTCLPSFSTVSYEGRFCLQLDYAIPSAGDYSWYASKLGFHNVSLSNFNGITFWIRGSSGNETMKVELKTVDCNTADKSNASLYVNDFLPAGRITTAWQQAVIPFKNFANITSFTKMDELTFVFEHDQSGTNYSPLSGSVFVDRIRFTNNPDGFTGVVQDLFSDRIPRNALGGNMGWAGGGGATASVSWDSTNYYGAPYSLKLTYNVTPSGSYAFVYSLFGGGKSGFVAQQCDFTNYRFLCFRTRAGRGTTNMAVLVEIDTDDSWPPDCSFICVHVRSNWKTYSLPLTNTSYIDRSKIAKLTFVMENSWLETADRNTSVYFDDIRFEK